MALAAGTRLGPYEITASIGAGGMGEVYRAIDSNLKRPVAIKVLPATVAGDADRLARFQREAEVLATLNHPNIAAIYGLEKSGDVTALVMELVDGDDLSAHITRASIPLPDGLSIARQIADALETAHELGIIHRDLKPANVKVRADGTVKVLDFGLAKVAERPDASVGNGSNATMTSPAMTRMGVILGTAAYMSPEQAKGRVVDKRADIWAFGVVLYEMLTGRTLFDGDSVAETIGFVATRDPDWAALPADTPASVRRLLARCLARDPRQRLRDIGEARIALAEPLEDSAGAIPAAGATSRRARGLAIGLALVTVLMVATTGYVLMRPAVAPIPLRLAVVASDTGFSTPAVSPDGRIVAFTKGGPKSMIWLRPLAAASAFPLAGTEGATDPFWSPDGSEIGFMVASPGSAGRRNIKKVPIGGGDAETLAEMPYAIHGTWSRDGIIVVSRGGGQGTENVLFSVPATGGTPAKLNDVSDSRWPSFLPDGRNFLFTVVSPEESKAGIYLGALGSADAARLTDVVSSAQYADGYMFYVKDQAVVAQPLDVAGRRLTGEAAPVFENVEFTAPVYRGAFSVAGHTLVAAARRSPRLRQFSWVDRSGTVISTLGDPGPFTAPDLSPDGKLVTVIRASDTGGPSALWMIDVERNVFSELRRDTTSAKISSRSDRIAFVNPDGIRMSSIRGGGDTLLLHTGPVRKGASGLFGSVSDWSPDDRYVAIQVRSQWQILDVTAPDEPIPAGDRSSITFSPAGGWIAYRAFNATQTPVFVEPFDGKAPTGAGRIQVSRGDGDGPRWRGDGRELFYYADGEILAVTVTPGSPPRLGTPRRLFSVPGAVFYDVSADGQRFLLATPTGEVTLPPLSVMLNWRAMLTR